MEYVIKVITAVILLIPCYAINKPHILLGQALTKTPRDTLTVETTRSKASDILAM